jgi:formylmethanofuran dehydrogenase subunit B
MTTTTKPIMIEFLRPILSSISPTRGEKIRAATSKALYAILTEMKNASYTIMNET